MSYLAPEYRELEKKLAPFIKEHELDEITVNSLIRGSIEVIEPEVPIASTTFIDTEDFNSAVSIKTKNIKVNLKFALDSIFSFKSFFDIEGLWLILAIVNAIVSLIGDMMIVFNEKEAVTLFALYRLRNADEKEIYKYVKNVLSNEREFEMDLNDIKDAINKLEKIGTIKMLDGKYCLSEEILVRNA